MEPNAGNEAVGVLMAFLVIIIIVGIAMLIPYIFFLLSLQKSLGLTKEIHGISPGLVWLLLIPLFNLGWQFYILSNTTKGIRGMLAKNECDDGSGGWNLGLTGAILACCSIIPFIGPLFSLGWLIVGIIYWVKIAEYNKTLTRFQRID